MRKKFLLVLSLMLLVAISFSIATPVYAEANLKCLKVIGDGVVEIKPDSVKVCAEIQTVDLDAVKSKNDNLEALNKITAILNENGIEDVVVDNFSFYPCYDYSQGKSLTGYCTDSDISFEIVDLDKIELYIDILTENGVTSIRSLTYSSSHFDEAYEEALKLAVENAEAKCVYLGGDNLSLVSISEEYSYSSNYLYRSYYEGLDLGEQTITVNAKVIAKYS